MTLKCPLRGRQAWSLVLLFVVLSVVSFTAQSKPRGVVRLAWDASPDPNVVGYAVHVGTTSGQYTQTFDVRKRRTFTYRRAVVGRRYFFAVSAYNDGGLGPLSSEVSVVAVALKPRARPAKPALNQSARSPSNSIDRR